jgi:carbamoylphosphate synthase large subunit
VKRRLLLTGAGSAATSNLTRSLRAGDRALTVVGCHSDRFMLKKSSADRNYLVPALTHPGYFKALRRVIAHERVDLLIPTTDAEVRAFTRACVELPCRLFLPRKAVVDLCQDKYRLNVALRSRGVPVPATYPVTRLRSLEAIFRRLPAREPVWCRVRSGSGSTGAIPVMRPDQARSWIAYWREMRGVPATSFILSEYVPGRDFSCQAIWKAGALVLVKTCERLSYFGGGGNPSGTSSISQLAKTVLAPEVVRVCTAAIEAIDPRASGTFNFDLRENARGVPCLTEINAGRFASGTNIFDLTGRSNLAATFVRVALGEAVALRETYDPAEGYYTVRDLDTLTGVFRADELFDKIVDARE